MHVTVGERASYAAEIALPMVAYPYLYHILYWKRRAGKVDSVPELVSSIRLAILQHTTANRFTEAKDTSSIFHQNLWSSAGVITDGNIISTSLSVQISYLAGDRKACKHQAILPPLLFGRFNQYLHYQVIVAVEKNHFR